MKKAVFVTGGTVGSGLASACRFAKEGYDVFIQSRDAKRAGEAAQKVADQYGVFAKGYGIIPGNEQDVIDVFRDIDATGRFVETVVLNAANMGFGDDPAHGLPVFEMTLDQFRDVLETNLVWNFSIIRQAALRMKEQKKGAIVFIGSNTAYRAIPNRAAYSASKGGILALSKALTVDLGPRGIRCNVVLPGTIKTARWVQMGNKQIVNGKLTPLGDISDFEDIANAAYYLGSDESKNVSGAEIMVDGGMTSQLYPEILTQYRREEIARQAEER